MKKTIKDAILAIGWNDLKLGMVDYWTIRGISAETIASDLNELKEKIENTEATDLDIIALRFIGMSTGVLVQMMNFYKKGTILAYGAFENPLAHLMETIVLSPYHDMDYLIDHMEKAGKAGIDIFTLTDQEISALLPLGKLLPCKIELSVANDFGAILGATLEVDPHDEPLYIAMDIMEHIFQMWKPDLYSRVEDDGAIALSKLYTALSEYQVLKMVAERY